MACCTSARRAWSMLAAMFFPLLCCKAHSLVARGHYGNAWRLAVAFALLRAHLGENVAGVYMLALDRREFIAALGGTAAIGLMSHEARADALEDALLARTQMGTALPLAAAAVSAAAAGQQPYPTVAELAAQVPDLP